MMQSSHNSSDDDEDNHSSRSRKDEAQLSSSKKNASKSKKPAASSRNLPGTSSQSRAADTGNDRFLSASERKRNREKERRNKLNHGLDELATLLFSIDPSLQTYGDAPSSPGSSWATNTPLPKEGAHTITNRVELINCTLKVLKQLHHENEERKQILNDLAKGGMVTIPHVDSAFVRSKKNPNIPPPSSSHESMQLLNQKRQMALLGRRSDGDLSQQPPLPPGFEGTAAPTRPSEDTRSPPLDSRMSPGQLIGGNEVRAAPSESLGESCSARDCTVCLPSSLYHGCGTTLAVFESSWGDAFWHHERNPHSKTLFSSCHELYPLAGSCVGKLSLAYPRIPCHLQACSSCAIT